MNDINDHKRHHHQRCRCRHRRLKSTSACMSVCVCLFVCCFWSLVAVVVSSCQQVAVTFCIPVLFTLRSNLTHNKFRSTHYSIVVINFVTFFNRFLRARLLEAQWRKGPNAAKIHPPLPDEKVQQQTNKWKAQNGWQ